MSELGGLVHRLRNTPVQELIAALKKEGFSLERETRTGGRIYGHSDGRVVVIHYCPESEIRWLTRERRKPLPAGRGSDLSGGYRATSGSEWLGTYAANF